MNRDGSIAIYLSGGEYKKVLILVCEINDLSVQNTELTFIEGTFTLINNHWETNNSLGYKYTTDVHFDKHACGGTEINGPSLFASNTSWLKPIIIKYINPNDATDIRYYFSLLFTKGNYGWQFIRFNGICTMDITQGSYISYTGSTLPEGYEIYQEPLPMRKLNLVSGYIGNDGASYSYTDIKALEDRISALENK